MAGFCPALCHPGRGVHGGRCFAGRGFGLGEMVAVRQRHRPTSCSVWQRRPAVPAGVTTMCRRRGSCGASSGQTEQSRVRIPRPRPTHYKCVALPSELTRREMGPPCPHASAPTVCGYPPQAHWAAVHASGDGEATSWWQGPESRVDCNARARSPVVHIPSPGVAPGLSPRGTPEGLRRPRSSRRHATARLHPRLPFAVCRTQRLVQHSAPADG